jgi:BirA family biotin operon repressor/biotin-[acetyl-CoA-carboxylase] ligase
MILSKETINQHFLAKSINVPTLHLFNSLDSTNTWLKKNGDCGEVCVAEQQTAGRGRRGNEWLSPDAENIYLSLKWCFDKAPCHLSLLSLRVGLSIAKALQAVGLSGHGVKWPNDIYWQGLKMGGILIESVAFSKKSASKQSLIIGIGLNINMPLSAGKQIDQPWVSLNTILGQQIDRHHLLALLLEHLMIDLQRFDTLNLAQFQTEWQQWDMLNGKQVKILQQHQESAGIVRGIDAQGRIVIELLSGQLAHYSSAEIRLKKGFYDSIS